MKNAIFAVALMTVFSNNWAQSTPTLSGSPPNNPNNSFPQPPSGITGTPKGPILTNLPNCGWNYPSVCSAKSMFNGTLTWLQTYSAYSDSVNLRFGLHVKSYAGDVTCMNNSATQGIIGFKPPLVYGSAQAQLQQDWRNMALMAKASGASVTIFTDGACNILDMALDQ